MKSVSHMTSRERMRAVMEYTDLDYIPCSFMLFYNIYEHCSSEEEFITRQLELGIDAFVHVGHLNHTLHMRGNLDQQAKYREWIEKNGDSLYFCRRIDTPKGPLTARVRQMSGWPTEDDFPVMKDWIVPRAKEVLVKPEEDLEKLVYLFGPFKDEDIVLLRKEAEAAKKLADRYGLLLVGGWKGAVRPGIQVDPGVMGADALAWLSGYEDVMVLSLTRPEIIKEYLNIIHEWNMRQIEIYLDVTDAELIVRRAWYETTEFWTPAVYREMIAPTIKREARLVHQAGRKYGYIVTSAFLPILDDILDAGVDVLIGLDPEEGKGTDLPVVKKKFSEKKRAIWGGVSGAITLEQGTKEQTEEAVVRALWELGRSGGFILSPVDNVREDTPNAWRNTHAFINAWKKFRQAPLKQ